MPNSSDLPSKTYNIGALSASGEGFRLNTDESGKKLMAETIAVNCIHSIGFEGKIRRFRKSGVRVSGVLKADIEQSCVVSMEPVQQNLEIEVDRSFLPESELRKQTEISENGELVIDPDDDESDALAGGAVDLWEVAIEELNLALDPFPRADGAEFSKIDSVELPETKESEDSHNPFANLNTLINEKKSKN